MDFLVLADSPELLPRVLVLLLLFLFLPEEVDFLGMISVAQHDI
jgi:hypothetical protein